MANPEPEWMPAVRMWAFEQAQKMERTDRTGSPMKYDDLVAVMLALSETVRAGVYHAPHHEAA